MLILNVSVEGFNRVQPRKNELMNSVLNVVADVLSGGVISNAEEGRRMDRKGNFFASIENPVLQQHVKWHFSGTASWLRVCRCRLYVVRRSGYWDHWSRCVPVNQSINIHWHHNSTLIASMHKNIMWHQTEIHIQIYIDVFCILTHFIQYEW